MIDVGDLNLTFKRYVESPIRLTFENDYITSVEGDGVDAELFKNYNQHWGDREAWAVSHLGWGLERPGSLGSHDSVRQAGYQRRRAALFRRKRAVFDRHQSGRGA